jgi:hypothetical protein
MNNFDDDDIDVEEDVEDSVVKPWGLTYNRENAKSRNCLKCDHKFLSYSFGNRLCNRCNAQIEHFGGHIKAFTGLE